MSAAFAPCLAFSFSMKLQCPRRRENLKVSITLKRSGFVSTMDGKQDRERKDSRRFIMQLVARVNAFEFSTVLADRWLTSSRTVLSRILNFELAAISMR